MKKWWNVPHLAKIWVLSWTLKCILQVNATTWMKSQARHPYRTLQTLHGPGFSFKWFALNCMSRMRLSLCLFAHISWAPPQCINVSLAWYIDSSYKFYISCSRLDKTPGTMWHHMIILITMIIIHMWLRLLVNES